MAKFTVTQEVSCNTETFWKRFFDQDTMKKAYLEALHYSDYHILEQSEADTELLRKVQLAPKMDLPGPIAKLLGSGFRYVEEGRFNKNTRIWQWKRIPSTLADKMRFEGTVRTEASGDNRIRYIAEIVIEAKIFGVGGLMESAFEKSMREEIDFFVKSLSSLA